MNPADQKPQYRHQDVGNQRRDDFAESATDDDTDSHVDHIAAQGKCLEFFQCFFHVMNPLSIVKRQVPKRFGTWTATGIRSRSGVP